MNGLSVIIVSYNTKEMTLRCIKSVEAALERSRTLHEILVVDNNSTDGSAEVLSSLGKDNFHFIRNTVNAGYGKANNQALSNAKYSHILYLNSDVIVGESIDFGHLLKRFENDSQLGALTVRVNLSDGTLDKASHRGFPTLWRSFCYYSGLEKLFGTIPRIGKLFGGYHLTHFQLDTMHEIDSPTGAFYMAPRELLNQLKGFDEDFFMYGEDLDLSFRIKRGGYKIIFDPTFTVIHHKYHSGLKNGNDNDVRKKTKTYFYESMAIFYRKHYEHKYPFIINRLVYFVIQIKSGKK